MPMRLAQLTEVVMARTQEELARLSGTNDDRHATARSARMVAKEKTLKQRFVDELQWHGISHHALYPIHKNDERGVGIGEKGGDV